jgi:hypothetical protein
LPRRFWRAWYIRVTERQYGGWLAGTRSGAGPALAIELLCRYAAEQKLTPRAHCAEELFDAGQEI